MEDTQIKYNLWQRGVKMTVEEIVKFQLLVHCYISSIRVTPLALDVLTIIGVQGECALTDIITELVDRGMFTQGQAARTLLSRMEDAGLVVKKKMEGTNKNKLIYLHPSIGIQNTTPIYAEVKAICI